MSTTKNVPLSSVWADYTRNTRGSFSAIVSTKKPKNPKGSNSVTRSEASASRTAEREALTSLKRSIDSVGLLTAITVVEDSDGGEGKYRVIAGYRRFAALTELSLDFPDDTRWHKIPILVVDPIDEIVVSRAGDEILAPDGSKTTLEEGAVIKVSPALSEAIRSQTENEGRRGAGRWDRIEAIARMYAEGVKRSELTRFFQDNGISLSETAFTLYGKVACFAPAIRERLRLYGDAGYQFAITEIGHKKYSTAIDTKTGHWTYDAVKQDLAIDKWIEEMSKAGGEKAPKGPKATKPGYAVKYEELAARREIIAGLTGGGDEASEYASVVLAVVDYLMTGDSQGMADAIGGEVAMALCTPPETSPEGDDKDDDKEEGSLPLLPTLLLRLGGGFLSSLRPFFFHFRNSRACGLGRRAPRLPHDDALSVIVDPKPTFGALGLASASEASRLRLFGPLHLRVPRLTGFRRHAQTLLLLR
jgi:hypothetical protein